MTRWLKFAAGGLLLAIPFAFVDWRATAAALLTAALLPLLLTLPLLVANMLLSAAKWDLLLRVQSIRPGFSAALQAYWIGSFFSNYLPSNVSGDVVRLIVLRAEGRRAEAASSILVERLTGLVVLVALAGLALALRPDHFDRFGLLPLLWLMVLGLAVAITLTFTAGEPLARALQNLAGRWSGFASRLLTIFARVSAALAIYRRRPGPLVVALALSVPFYGISIGFQFLLLDAVGADLGFFEVALVAPVVQLIGLLPLAPNGLGLVEGAFVLFYMQAGVPAELALAAALLRRALSFAVSLIGGVIWLAWMRAAPELAAASRNPVSATESSGPS